MPNPKFFTNKHSHLFGIAVIVSLIVAGCTTASSETSLPLVRSVVNQHLVPSLLETDEAVYMATPLFPNRENGQQKILKLSPDLQVETVVDSPGRGIFTFDSPSESSLSFIREGCQVLNGTGSECSTVGSVKVTGIEDSETLKPLELDAHELRYTDGGAAFWAIKYPEVSCINSQVPICQQLLQRTKPVNSFKDCEIVKVQGNEVIWSWRASDVIPTSDSLNRPTRNDPPADPFHCNSVEEISEKGLIIVSMRHTDALYFIRISDGEVVGKLGGQNWPEVSMKLVNPENMGYGVSAETQTDLFAGQHDARYWGNGVLSVFDNGSGANRVARGMVFDISSINSARVTAIYDDPAKNVSNCTGSFRSLKNGEFWLANWGCSLSGLTVFAANGQPVVELRIDKEKAFEAGVLDTELPEQVNSTISYRAIVGPKSWLK